MTLKDVIYHRLGTAKPSPRRLLSTKLANGNLLHTVGDYGEFDSRLQWPGLISLPPDQENCGSSWVYSTAGERTAVCVDWLQSRGLQHVTPATV